MTVYNRERYVAEAIESVLNSSFESFEFIIVDDCSTDNSFLIIESYASKDARIKYYRNKTNLGDYANRNRAASLATGKYIQYVDSDDLLLIEGLKYTVMQMDSNPHADLGMFCGTLSNLKQVFFPREAIQYHFFRRPFLQVGPGGTIMKRDFFEKIGPYPTIYGPANDNYFNLHAASQGTILLLTREFLFYRRHAGQEINNLLQYLPNNFRYLNDALNQLDLGLTTRQQDWIKNKNKRRFVVNIFKHLLYTRDIRPVLSIVKRADFKWTYVIKAVFQRSGPPPADICYIEE